MTYTRTREEQCICVYDVLFSWGAREMAAKLSSGNKIILCFMIRYPIVSFILFRARVK